MTDVCNRTIEYEHGIFDSYIADPEPEHWIETFPGLMQSLGFEMDCYKSYNALYQDKSFEYEIEKQDYILNNLKNSPLQVVGNYIFSRFRELTHWSDYGYAQERAAYFFPIAFKILEEKFNQND